MSGDGYAGTERVDAKLAPRAMMDALDGFDAGYDKGRREGFDLGHADGRKTGEEQGYDRGYDAGRKVGVREAAKLVMNVAVGCFANGDDNRARELRVLSREILALAGPLIDESKDAG